MHIPLPSLAATDALARAFASCVTRSAVLPPVLMRGALGAGKTTFVRHLVLALPGSEKAEVSSPSFNLLNLYPTTPPVGHFDLYRTSGLGFGADLEETLFAPDHFCLLEWAEYLPAECLPESFVEMAWSVEGEGRIVEISAHGPAALTFMACVGHALGL
jgi:tRNA threonylcarbamoyladenosine biosynthesis protein TsaE